MGRDADVTMDNTHLSVSNQSAEVGSRPSLQAGAIVCGDTNDLKFDHFPAQRYRMSCDPWTLGQFVHLSRADYWLVIVEVEVYVRGRGNYCNTE